MSGIEAQALAVDPGNPQILYAAGDSVYKSTDEGLNWQPLSVLGSELLDARSILVDPNDWDRIYLVSIAPGEGLFLSQDAGETWDPVDVPVYHETRASFLTAADLILPHLVSNRQYFTGIAIANARNNQPSVSGAIELYSSSAELIATHDFELGSYERSSLLLTEYFPELVGQSIGSGYVRIRADRPIACVALYGAWDLSTFSVIPV
ncbi:MAG: hypothetical protein WAO20_18130, partial [Acidobacteriota bacterium]